MFALLIGYSLAYVIAFRGGRLRNALLPAGDRAVRRHLPDQDAVVGDDPVDDRDSSSSIRNTMGHRGRRRTSA